MKIYNGNKEWLKDFVYYLDNNLICYGNTIKIKFGNYFYSY